MYGDERSSSLPSPSPGEAGDACERQCNTAWLRDERCIQVIEVSCACTLIHKECKEGNLSRACRRDALRLGENPRAGSNARVQEWQRLDARVRRGSWLADIDLPRGQVGAPIVPDNLQQSERGVRWQR